MSLFNQIETFVKENKDTLSKVDSYLKIIFQTVEEVVREAMANAQKYARPVEVRIKKLETFRGDLPSYQSEGASGFDVRACLEQTMTLQPGERALIPTGLSFEIPTGFEIQARPRSGLAIKQGLGLVNSPGTIDADYRGEVKIIVINLGREAIQIADQDRIAQLVLAPVIQAKFIEAEALNETDRGAGGFGSTGV